MSNANYEKIAGSVPNSQDQPPPYSYPEQPPVQTSPPMAYGAYPPMPNQLYYGVPDQDPKEQLNLQPEQAVQPTSEPDYLAYSIFTTICCFLPVGVVALVYSVLTREANREGNSASAKHRSRLARILSHTALGLGIGFLILYIGSIVFLFLQ